MNIKSDHEKIIKEEAFAKGFFEGAKYAFTISRQALSEVKFLVAEEIEEKILDSIKKYSKVWEEK